MKKVIFFMTLVSMLVLTNLFVKGQNYSFTPFDNPTNSNIDCFWGYEGKVYGLNYNGEIAYYDGSGTSWSLVDLQPPTNVSTAGIAGQDLSNILVVGQSGHMYKGNGTTFNPISFPVSVDLKGVCFLGSTAYIVGDESTFYSYNGSTFTDLVNGAIDSILFRRVYALSSTEIWLIGHREADFVPVIYLYNGSGFTLKYTGTVNEIMQEIYYADNTNLYLFAKNYQLCEFNKSTGTMTVLFPSSDYLYGAWVFGPNDIYASQGNPNGLKKIFHYNGTDWATISSTLRFDAYWGFSSTGLFYGFNDLTGKLYKVEKNAGISESDIYQAKICPNPVNDRLFVSGNFQKEVSFEIMDLEGKVVSEYPQLSGKDFYLDISGLAPGVYFLTILSENEKITKKIVKQ